MIVAIVPVKKLEEAKMSSVNYFFSLTTIKTSDLLTHSPEGE